MYLVNNILSELLHIPFVIVHVKLKSVSHPPDVKLETVAFDKEISSKIKFSVSEDQTP